VADGFVLTILGEFKKSKFGKVIIKKGKKSDKDFVDIRYYYYDIKENDFKPSPKGVRLHGSDIQKTLEILLKEFSVEKE
jgi:hypothetical protein